MKSAYLSLIGIDMNNKFTPLDCNDDVILFEKDTFKVSRLKELLYTEITNKLSKHLYNYQTKNPEVSILGSFCQVSIGQEHIQLNEIQVHSIKACQILQVGGKSWQKGNLKIQVNQSIVNNQLIVYLEFCSDKPDEPESPLDEIRQMILNQT